MQLALPAHVSCWIKRHHPDAFLAALLNSQPMGFHQPAQLIADARRHQVTVLPVDVTHSDWDCTLGPVKDTVRLGIRLVNGLSQAAAEAIVCARRQQTFDTVEDLAERAGLQATDLRALAAADCQQTLAGHPHLAQWQALGTETRRTASMMPVR
jgi:error-prone DNA polymerase